MTMRPRHLPRQPNGYPRHLGSNGIRFELTDRELRTLRAALEMYRDATRHAPPVAGEANAPIAAKLLHLLCAGELPDEPTPLTAWRLALLSGADAVRFRAAMKDRGGRTPATRHSASTDDAIDASRDWHLFTTPERAGAKPDEDAMDQTSTDERPDAA